MFIKLEGHTEVASRLQGKENSKESKAALNNDKVKNSPIRHNNPKEMGTKQESMKICKVKTDRTRKPDKSTSLVGDFNTTCSVIDLPTPQKISKFRADVNNTTNHLDPTDMYKILYSKQNTHSSQAQFGIFTKTGHIVSCRIHINKQKSYKICSEITMDLS